MPSQKSLELAATAWCQMTTSNTVMNPDLAIEFAKILDSETNGEQIKIKIDTNEHIKYER